MTASVDIEELQTTKSEKLLAFVFVVFLLIGGVWSYQEIDDRVRETIELAEPTAAERAAIDRESAAQQRLFAASSGQDEARRDIEFRREEFRAALDADRPSGALERDYRAAQERLAGAQAEHAAATRALAAARPAAEAAQKRVSARIEERRDRQELVTFLLRLALVIASLLAGYLALARLRNRGSRYLPLGGAVVVFGTILAFALAVDYLTDYFNPLDSGLLLLSLMGLLTTVAAFWVLQRYLARRLPHRRVRRGQCPFCAFPVQGNPRCEGCGREVIAPCTRCERPRRVGTSHCAHCGAA
ncbi:MAG: zinc ribbon domain-containing protein [Actinobacteria bacterium]|nr:zinc ribbon domain-containing protein [Actinomycetota bacterium]